MSKGQIRTDHKYRTEWVAVKDICIPEYQRQTRTHWVKYLAKNFNKSFLGTFSLSRRSDGKFYVVDGQHRLFAIRAQGDLYADMKVECRVYDGLSIAEEADLFRRLNDNLRMRRFDDWRAGVFANDPIVMEITKIAGAAGYTVIGSNGLACVASLQKVYNGIRIKGGNGAKVLADTLKVCANAFGVNGESPGRYMVEGVAILLELSGDKKIDIDRLTKKLAQRRGGEPKILGDAKQYQTTERGALSFSVAEIMRREYNSGLHGGNKLAPLR